jgi:hemerythrin-like domain-containing protein
MVNKNQGDVGTDIIRFHRIITRSLEIVIQNVNKYLETGSIKETEREGFLKYIQSFSTVMDAHHVLENEKIFPYFKNKLPDAPYERLMTQHEWVKTALSKIGEGINNLKSNVDELDSLNSIKTGLKLIDKIWHPHIRIEEEQIYGRVGSLNLGLEETKRLREEFSQFFEEHAEPASLVVPFLLYNLSEEDRAIQSQLIPEIVTKQLVEKDWKDEWAPMQPFLLK